MRKKAGKVTKAMLSLLLSLLLVLSGLPMEGLREAYAADKPITITKISVLKEKDGEGNTKSTKLEIRGTNLKGVDVKSLVVSNSVGSYTIEQMDGKVTSPSTSNVLLTVESVPKSTKPEYSKDLNFLPGAVTEIIIGATQGYAIAHGTYRLNVRVPDIDPVSSVQNGGNNQSKIQYVEEALNPPLILEGSGLSDVSEIMIGGAGVDMSSANVDISPAGDKIEIKKIATYPTLNGPRYHQISLTKTGTAEVVDTAATVPMSFTITFNDYITPIKRLTGLEKLEIRPRKGAFDRENRFDIVAYKSDDTLNQAINTQGLSVFLRNPKSKNPQEIPLTILNKGTSEKSIQVRTPVLSKETGVNDYKFDVIVQRTDGARSIKEQGYELIDGLKKLTIKKVIEPYGKNTQPDAVDDREKVLISGEQIIRIDEEALDITDGGLAPTTTLAAANYDSATKEIIIQYTKGSNAKYNGKPITKVEKRISLRIGQDLEPKKVTGSDAIVTFTDLSRNHHYYGSAEDGVVFVLPKTITAKKYPVEIKTETTITYQDGATSVEAIIPDEDIKKDGFEYIQHPLEPKVTGIEPAYGYYHDYNKPPHKPLVLRFSGANFKVEKQSDGTLKYPTVKIYDISGTETEITDDPDGEGQSELKVTGKKILDDKEQEVGIKNNIGTGSQFVIEIETVGAHQLRERIKPNSPQDDTYNLPVKFRITNPDGGYLDFNAAGTAFFFRHPIESDLAELRKMEPRDLKAYDRWDKEVSTFASNKENEITLKFKVGGTSPSLNDVLVTLDGKVLSIPKTKEARYKVPGENDLYAIKFKAPKGLFGTKKAQVIMPNGLMDSVDLNFTRHEGPWILSVVPQQGPAGTWIVITRDPNTNPNAYFLDKTDPSNPATGSRVILSAKNKPPIYLPEYKWINQDTIEAKIPDNLPATVEYMVEIENPGGLKSNGVLFTLIDVADSSVKLGTISPNRGNPEGKIEVTITAAPGYLFGKKDGTSEEKFRVFFGNEESRKVKVSLDRKKLFVEVPKLTVPREEFWEPDKEYPVRVTVQNAIGATDSIENGFIYSKPSYQDKFMRIDKIYKKDTDPETNKGKEGEFFVIQGTNFRVIRKPPLPAPNGEFILPIVKFGYSDAKVILDKTKLDPTKNEITLDKLIVQVPEKPEDAASDGSVTVYVVNEDGGTAKKAKGFIYKDSKPRILSGIFRANRLGDTIYVDAEDVTKETVMVAFGSGEEVFREKLLDNNRSATLEFNNPIGDLQVHYEYKDAPDATATVKYKDPITKTWVLEDEFRLDENTMYKKVRIPWKNYPLKESTMPDHLKNRLNDEWVYVKLDFKSAKEKLVVRRMLGEVLKDEFKEDGKGKATVYFKTPYHKLDPNSNIMLFHPDDSNTGKNKFEFHGNFDLPVIKDIEESEARTEIVDGVQTDIKVYETDYSEGVTIRVIGENLRDIETILLGDRKITKWAPDLPEGEKISIEIPKGKEEDVGKLQVIQIITKAGLALSNKATPPVYFRYIYAPSKPVIESIQPDFGPRTGGTRIQISGTGFKDTDEFGNLVTGDNALKIMVDGKPSKATIKNRDAKGFGTLMEALTPEIDYGKGKVDVQVINADKGKSKAGAFIYISQPQIFKRTPAGAPDDKGEQWIRLTGEDFQKGAKVYIGGKRKKITKPPSGNQGKTVFGMGPAENGLNTFYELIDAEEIKDVKVEDANNMQFSLPKELDLDDSLQMKVTIINKDGGISKEFLMTAFDTPMISELAPNQGPVGTLVSIKADARGDNFKHDKPPLTIVRFDGVDIPAEVKDAGNILFLVPEEITKKDGTKVKIVPGDYEVTVTNMVQKPDGTYEEKTSPPAIFHVIETKDRIELKSIDPDKGDIAGGIPATITAKQGKFSAGDKVLFGTQPAVIEGISPDGTKIYVRVPKWTGKKINVGESVPVTVTVQKPSGATGSLIDGFVYYNAVDSDKVKITAVYKDGVSPRTDKGQAQDVFWVEGNHFVIKTEDAPKRVIYPDVYIGHEKAQILEDYLPSEVKDQRILNKIPIRIPERTKLDQPNDKKPNAGQKKEDANRVDVTVVNPDGSVGRLPKGFEYIEGGEDVDADTKKLTASRFGDKLKIESKNIPRDHYVVFGKNAITPDHFDLGIRQQQWTTTHSDVEKVVIKYLGPDKQQDNFEIYYQKKDGKLLLMGEGADGGKVTLRKPGDRKLVKLDWKNPEYHENTNFAQNPALLNKLHDEYMLLELVKTKGEEKVTLRVTRGIGKVDDVAVEARKDKDKDHFNKVTTFVTTPYHERAEVTDWTLITKDGERIFDSKVQEKLKIEFTEPVTGLMEITDIEGSENKKINLGGKEIEAKIKTLDIRQPGIIRIIGKGFPKPGDVTAPQGNNADAKVGDLRVKIGEKYAPVLEVGEDGDYIMVQVPIIDEKDRAAIINKLISVDVHSKKGNVFSSKMIPPIYLMFVQPESTPIVTELKPDKGPRTGGTRVTVSGKGFRDLDAVGVQGSIKYSIDGSKAVPISKPVRDEKGNIKELEIIMPAGKTGLRKIQIINADGGTSELKDFLYISQPKIQSLHIEGKKLVIQGIDFQDKSKAYLGSTLQIGGKKPLQVQETGILGVENGKNRPAYVIGGKSYDTKYVSDKKLTIDLDEQEDSLKSSDQLMKELLKGILNTSLILYSPDEGVSEPSGKATEALIPEVPIITASPGAEGSVVLSWKVDQEALNKAKKFEIYAKRSSDREYTFVGDTMQNSTNQAFIVKGLEHGEDYDFKVRVLNDAGEAKDFGTVRGFTLSAANDYKQQEKQAEVDRMVKKIEMEGKQEIVGNAVRHTVGIAQNVVDLSKHTKYKNKQVQIPIREVQNHRGKTLHIIDGNMNLRMTYASLSSPETALASNDALMRIHISSADSKQEGALRKAVGRNKSRLSPIYKVDFEVVDPKKIQRVNQLTGKVNIGISSSKGQGGYIATYVEAEDKFRKLPNAAISKGGYYVLLRDKNE